MRLVNRSVAMDLGEVGCVCLAWEDKMWSERVEWPSLAVF